jgi:hypothetical protein
MFDHECGFFGMQYKPESKKARFSQSFREPTKGLPFDDFASNDTLLGIEETRHVDDSLANMDENIHTC